tara:strand:- start:61 stop:261 length:201 start_codon:yes stop_codon:yes gene_type:complete
MQRWRKKLTDGDWEELGKVYSEILGFIRRSKMQRWALSDEERAELDRGLIILQSVVNKIGSRLDKE